MADFNALGRYKFVYRDDGDEDIVCSARAADDGEALDFARQAQHGMALEVWCGGRCVERFARPDRFHLWDVPSGPSASARS